MATATPILPKLIGERVKRREDPRLIQGRGTYVDDLKITGMLHLAFKRCDIAHGTITKIDTSAAANMDGVEAIFTGADIAKVLMVQSYHQPVEYLEFLVNKKKFEALPKDLQAIVKYAVMAESADGTWKYFMDANSKDLAEFKTKGVKVIPTPRSVLEAQLKAWDTIVERESNADPFFDKVVKSQKEWAARVVPLRSEVMVDNRPAFEHYFKS